MSGADRFGGFAHVFLMYHYMDVFMYVAVVCLYRHTFKRASIGQPYVEILSLTG